MVEEEANNKIMMRWQSKQISLNIFGKMLKKSW